MRVPTTTATGPVLRRPSKACLGLGRPRGSHTKWTKSRGLDTTNATDGNGANNTTYTYSDANSVLRLTAGASSYTNGFLGTATKTTGGTTTAYAHLPAGTTLSQTTSGTSTYYVTDRQGSTIESLDDTGAHLDYDYYDPTGYRTYGSHADYTWQGLTVDPNNFYKTGLRYLSYGTGRFTQLDPTHKDDRAYAYADNNPITYADPKGACVFCDLAGAAGTVLLGAVAIAALPEEVAVAIPVGIAVGTALVAGALIDQARSDENSGN